GEVVVRVKPGVPEQVIALGFTNQLERKARSDEERRWPAILGDRLRDGRHQRDEVGWLRRPAVAQAPEGPLFVEHLIAVPHLVATVERRYLVTWQARPRDRHGRGHHAAGGGRRLVPPRRRVDVLAGHVGNESATIDEERTSPAQLFDVGAVDDG